MLRMERGQTLIGNKLKKLIKKKRNAHVKTIIGETTPWDLKDSRGLTLLHLAVAYDNHELAKYFIDIGCNVNARDIFKNTPLTLALSATPKRNLNLIKLLLETDSDILLTNQANRCPLYMFIHDPLYGPLDLARELFECLIAAINRCNRVDDMADVIVQAKCKLYHVVLMRNVELTKAVLRRRQTIEWQESDDALVQAMYLMDLGNTQALLYYGPGANDRSEYFFQNLLMFATDIEGRNLQILEAFVKDIAEWSIWNMNEIEVLARLFETADDEALYIFLQHDIHLRIEKAFDVNLTAHCGGNSNPAVVELMRQSLIKTRKFPSPGLNQKSVLHFAVQNGVFENVRTLFEFDIDPNIKDTNGRTPLFSAFCLPHDVDQEKRKKCALTLLMNQADPQIFDKHGVSVLDFITSEEDWCVAQVVLQCLAWRKLRGEIHEKFDEASIIVINSDVKLTTYYNKCLEQLQEMKKHEFSIYMLIMQETFVIARKVRNNAAIQINEMNLARWHYYYRKLLQQIICTLKTINDCKSELRCIILDCLEVLRPYELITDHILDYFTSADFLYFSRVFNLH